MTDKQAGLSAMAMAYGRAYHALHDTPKIFDDFLAPELLGPPALAQYDQAMASMLQYIDPALAAAASDPAAALAHVVRLTNGPITLGRSRYTEDSLTAALAAGTPVRQYVILGAGFDTFAYRRPDLAGRLRVFELDHPATQALKRERVAAAGWPHPANLHLVPVDFTRESLDSALARSPYDRALPAFFSWLGVSFYLPRAVVFETLRAVAAISAPGSQIVFDYLAPDAFDPQKSGPLMQQMQWMAVQLGEPMQAGFDPRALAAELSQVGLRLVENLAPPDIEERIFRGSNGYHALPHFHYARARIA